MKNFRSLFKRTEEDARVDDRHRKFLWIIPLAEHTRPLQFFAFIFAVFVAKSVAVFLSGSQAFILTAILLERDNNGDITGSLVLYGEIMSMVMVGLWGVVSDRIQKRTVYSISLLLKGLAVILYPQVKNVYPGLLLLRLVFAAGTAGCITMMPAMMTDVVYGKGGMVSGLIGAFNGLGSIFSSFFLFSIPTKLGISTGSSAQGAILAFGIIGGCTMFLGIVLWFFLPKALQVPVENIYIRLKKGLMAGKDPQVALAFATSFFVRADEVILTSFISLWVNQYYIDNGQCQVGQSCSLALGTTGTITGIGQSVSLISAPFFGMASEFLTRSYSLIAAGLIGAAGCFPFAFSFDPTTKASLAFVILIAIGELGMMVSGMALLNGPSIPQELRGSISGTYSFIGAFGVIIMSKIGGVLFDKWMKGAPFLLLGIGHCLVSLFAIVVLSLNKRRERMVRIKEEKSLTQVPVEELRDHFDSDDTVFSTL
ncbi:major facilitator superfamily domain-containing protein [Umbelopsis sp. PMI_123]|nr:major facilitator superfamily domain-containing protein [Umbelopsis sp. PMI_123]